MSSIYTPSPTVHGSYVLPSDGDPAVAESVNDALRDLADGVLNANTNASAALALASQMINGVTGGTYSPAADIVLTGGQRLHLNEFGIFIEGTSGLVVDSSFSVSTSGWSFSSPGVISGDVTFNTGGVSFEGFSTSGTASIFDLSVRGDTSIGNSASDEMNVVATATFQGPASFLGITTFDGESSFNNVTSFNNQVNLGESAANSILVLGQLFLTSRLRYSDTGRVPYKAPFTLPSTSATVGISDGEVFVIDYTLAATRTYTCSNSHASPGDKLIFASFVNNNLGAQVTIMGTAISGVAQGLTFAAGSANVYAEFVYVSATSFYPEGWRPMVKEL